MYAEQTMPEKDYAARGVGMQINASSGPWATEAPSSLVHGTIKDAADINCVASEIEGLLGEMRGRLFGPWPEAGGTAKLREASSGQAGDLKDTLGSLRATLYRVQDHARALASSI